MFLNLIKKLDIYLLPLLYKIIFINKKIRLNDYDIIHQKR